MDGEGVCEEGGVCLGITKGWYCGLLEGGTFRCVESGGWWWLVVRRKVCVVEWVGLMCRIEWCQIRQAASSTEHGLVSVRFDRSEYICDRLYFSISVFQNFRISVFRCFGISVFRYSIISVF